MPTVDAYSFGHLVLSHFGACMCSNVETNLSWTCLVSGLLNFEHPSVLLFCSVQLAVYRSMCRYSHLIQGNVIDVKSQAHVFRIDTYHMDRVRWSRLSYISPFHRVSIVVLHFQVLCWCGWTIGHLYRYIVVQFNSQLKIWTASYVITTAWDTLNL